MAEAHQMVPGFNHNVKHRGNAYHVQTEDSGVANPRIITHLFLGGNILASKKTSYGEIVGADELKLMVRELMEEQHKDVLRNLVCGVYDDVDEDQPGAARAYQPGELATEAEPPPQAEAQAAPEGPAFGAPYAEAAPMLPDLMTPMRPQVAATILPDLTTPMRPQVAAPVLPDLTTPMRPQVAAPILPDLTAPMRPQVAAPILPDLTAPMRPQIAAPIVPDLTTPMRPQVAAPILPDLTAGSVASLPGVGPAAATPAAPPPLARGDRLTPPPFAPPAPEASDAGPRMPRGGSVVEMLRGEDLLTEKSLDEVILSYLAEEPTKNR